MRRRMTKSRVSDQSSEHPFRFTAFYIIPCHSPEVLRSCFSAARQEKSPTRRPNFPSHLLRMLCPLSSSMVSRLRQQSASFRGISRPSRKKRKYHRTFVRCGNHVKFCCPASVVPADRLRVVFFNAPVPAGCTLMTVPPRETASVPTCGTRSRRNRTKIRSSAPFLLRRFMRVQMS